MVFAVNGLLSVGEGAWWIAGSEIVTATLAGVYWGWLAVNGSAAGER